VLFEMLTGRRPFDGPSQSPALPGVLERAPDWTALPATTPERVRWVLDRCLEKDPRERLRDIGEARVALGRQSAAATAPLATARRTRIPIVVGVAMLLAGLVAGFALGTIVGRRPEPQPAGERLTFTLAPPSNHVFGAGFGPAAFVPNVEIVSMAVSPDGSHLAFVATSADKRQIWLRPLSAADPRPLEGTEGALAIFWSPDGRSIGFFADDRLKRIDLPNGRPIPLCDVSPNTYYNGTWGRDAILYASSGPIFRVPPGGGTPVVEVEPDRSGEETSVGWPWFHPDGRHYFYTARNRNREGALKLGEIGSPSTHVMPLISNVQWVDPDLLVFARDGTLMAQRFDLDRRAAIGDPSPISDQIQYSRSTSRANFAVSRRGVVIYQSHFDQTELVWIDRAGKERNRLKDQADYPALRLTADGRTALVNQSDTRVGSLDIWSIDLDRGVRQRVTFDPTSELLGAWVPGKASIVFSAERRGVPNLFTKNLRDGVERELRPVGNFQIAYDVSPDGQDLIYYMRGDNGQSDLWRLSLVRNAEPTRLTRTPFGQFDVRYAPDGQHVTLTSNESGRPEIYVASVPNLTDRLPVSSGGGTMARWAPDGTEIFYLSGDRHLMSVRVTSHDPIRLAPPQPLFALTQPWRAFEVSPTGQFLAIVPKQLGNAQPLTAVLNWTQALRPRSQ
jgi:eukaryotic-like serine/threonine-protein kinase